VRRGPEPQADPAAQPLAAPARDGWAPAAGDVVSENVVKLLPNYALCMDLAAIAERLRTLADRIESGEFGQVERVVCVMENPDQVLRRTYGRPTTNMELLGILEYAKNSVLNPTDED
jgi:hypothetical protein